VARKLRERNVELPFALFIVNSVQEEIGLRGAEMIAKRINPDVAIITDVCHDTQSPMYDKIKSGDQSAGKGPVLTYGPAVQNNLLNMVIDVAEKNNINFQRAAASRSTGTDTDAFAYSNAGVASALISLPLKYMHTTVETAHTKDIDDVIELIFEFLRQLEAGYDFRYLK
jgi:putative aminopeptidase FrvX